MVSRLLAIVVTVLSIAFLGFAGVVTLGGPNWDGTARSLKDYHFTHDPGPNGQWTATSPDGESVGSSPLLPGVIVAALDDTNKKLQDQLGELNVREPQLRDSIQKMEQQMAADREALSASLARKQQQLKDLQEQSSQISNQVVQQTTQGIAVEKVVSDRRSDVLRLTNQLAVLRADEARIEQIHQQMVDLIEQINADLDKARQREQQLRLRLGK